MFIDFVALLLINMAAGFFLLACFLYWGLGGVDPKRWVPAFSMVGIIALISGFRMAFTWPLPGSFNVAYGEMSIVLGILFLGGALAVAKEWDLKLVAVYGLFAGVAALLIGIRIIDLGMTKEPLLSGVGFILSGASGILATPVLYLRTRGGIRLLGAIVLVATALIWARTGYKAYWGHLDNFSTWVPSTMETTNPRP